MSSSCGTPTQYGLRPSHTHAQFYGPSAHNSPAPTSPPTLSTAPCDAIYRIMEMDPSSALTLAVASRAFTPLARFFVRANTAAIFGMPWSDCGLGNNVLHFREHLIANNGEHRSCVVFHWSNVRMIRDMGLPCRNRILTPREMTLNHIVVSGLETQRILENHIASTNTMWNNLFARLQGVATPSTAQQEDTPPPARNNSVDDVD